MSSPKSSLEDDNDLYDNDDHYDDYRESYGNSNRTYSDMEDSTNESDDEIMKEKGSGIKEQMYQDKLGFLKHQLQQLREGTHTEYQKKLKKIESSYEERLKENDLCNKLEIDCIEREFVSDQRASVREFEEKKSELKENLLLELEEKKKIIEQERYTLELTGDSMEYKPVNTRKLRRRGNEPPPLVEKRRKPIATAMQLLLDEKDADDDLREINKSKVPTVKKSTSYTCPTDSTSNYPRIENGKLFFDKKWFCKGQSVYIECKDGTKFVAELAVTGVDFIMVKRVPENTRVRITLPQLAHGKFIVKRRSS